MAKEYKTKWVYLETPLMYARLFEANRDKNSIHSDTDGITCVDLVLTQEQVDTLKSYGVPEKALGYDTFKVKEGVDGFIYKVKRPWVSKYFKDETTGDPVVVGAPTVFDYNKAKEAWEASGEEMSKFTDFITPWSETDLIGNGSVAKVKLSIYSGTNKAGKPTNVVQLESVGIVEYAPYEGTDNREPWF